MQATKLEKQRYDRQDARFELFYEGIGQAKERLEMPTVVEHTLEENKHEYLLSFADIHYGSTFKSENNEYSREECAARFGVILSATRDYVLKNGITHLKVLNCGDCIQGLIHMTDLQINDIPVVEAVVQVSRLLADFLNKLSAYCTIEYYQVPESNHSQTRNLGSKASELAAEDMDTIIFNYISDLLANNDRVKTFSNIGKDYVDFKIFDFDVIAMHGHTVKNKPLVIKDMSTLHRKWYSYAFLGHLHTAEEITVGEENGNNIEVITVPSVVGSCPYSDSIRKGCKAMAKIYEFDAIYGHTGTKTIILN